MQEPWFMYQNKLDTVYYFIALDPPVHFLEEEPNTQ